MGLIDFLFGRPLASDEESHQRVGPTTGIPIFGLDALGSAAYGPEAALTVLLPLAAAGPAYALPLTIGVVVLLAFVYFSYRQTIAAYPTGGGSYTVARQNLGPKNGPNRWKSDSSGCTAYATCSRGGCGECLAAPAGICERLRGNDRRRSGE